MGNLFTGKSEQYHKGRQGYAPELLPFITSLVPAKGAKAADIGAGTGIFSRKLLDAGYAVCGVEPEENLRKLGEESLRAYDAYRSVAASAEDTGLPAHSVDLITAASAFHWFEPEGFGRECRRILKTGGYVLLIYNVRNTENPFAAEHTAICRRYCPRFTSLQHGAEYAARTVPGWMPGYKRRSFSHDLIYTKEQFLARSLSSSYSITEADQDYESYCRALTDMTKRYAGGDTVTVENDTVVWYGQL